ncbi:MAG: DNA-binding protein [Porticoccaceae bacterium]|jgi:gp16 family phage-associated protein
MHQPLTPEQARAALDHEGKSIADFAREHNLDEPTVYQVLAGRKQGRRGEAHRAACLLGLKVGNIAPAIRLPATPQVHP